ncbi:MAG: hypothetical protein ACYDAP_13510, partial [Thermoplasmataceae archaeon]
VALEKGINVSNLVGDFYGSRLVEIAKAIGLYLERKFTDLDDFLKTLPPPKTPVVFYNDVVTSLQECLNHIKTGERLKINEKITEFRHEGGLTTLIVQVIYLMADYLKDNNRENFEIAVNIIRKSGLTTSINTPGESSNGKR